MFLNNKWDFGGEIVRLKDFGNNKGGNVMIRGTSNFGGIVEISVFMNEKIFSKIINRDNNKYQRINANGHFELRIHETKGNNLKQSLKLIADDFQWAS